MRAPPPPAVPAQQHPRQTRVRVPHSARWGSPPTCWMQGHPHVHMERLRAVHLVPAGRGRERGGWGVRHVRRRPHKIAWVVCSRHATGARHVRCRRAGLAPLGAVGGGTRSRQEPDTLPWRARRELDHQQTTRRLCGCLGASPACGHQPRSRVPPPCARRQAEHASLPPWYLVPQVYVGLNQRTPTCFDMYKLDIQTAQLTLVAENPGGGGWDHLGRDAVLLPLDQAAAQGAVPQGAAIAVRVTRRRRRHLLADRLRVSHPRLPCHEQRRRQHRAAHKRLCRRRLEVGVPRL